MKYLAMNAIVKDVAFSQMKAATGAVTGALKGAGILEDTAKTRLKELEKNLHQATSGNQQMEVYISQLKWSIEREKQRADAVEVKFETCREKIDDLNMKEVNSTMKLLRKDIEMENQEKEIRRLKTELEEREIKIRTLEDKLKGLKKGCGFRSLL